MSIEAGPPTSINGTEVLPTKQWARVLEALFSESLLAKVWFVASKAMGSVSYLAELLYVSHNSKPNKFYADNPSNLLPRIHRRRQDHIHLPNL